MTREEERALETCVLSGECEKTNCVDESKDHGSLSVGPSPVWTEEGSLFDEPRWHRFGYAGDNAANIGTSSVLSATMGPCVAASNVGSGGVRGERGRLAPGRGRLTRKELCFFSALAHMRVIREDSQRMLSSNHRGVG